MLIRGATLLDGTVVDIRVDGTIAAVGADLETRPGEQVFDAHGRTVIPGLHDHHAHLHAAAAALTSVRVGPGEVRDRTGLAEALARAPIGGDGWIRAVGYHEAVAGPLDRALLDELSPPVPVRVQHRSGVLWTVNTAGLARLGLADHPDGRLRSDDHGWSDTLPRNEIPIGDVSRRLAAFGVTGVTDATPDLAPADVAALTANSAVLQRVHCLAPGKRILHDTDLDLDALSGWITARHAEDIPVAVHCVTAAQLVVTLAALQAAGTRPGDRIEHAAIVPDDSLAALAASGATVVTQPNFVTERGDQYLVDVPAAEHRELWRVASLLKAGVPVALSTDTPFGDGDPWAAMRAAVARTTASGPVLGADERVSPRAALTMFLGTAEHPARPRVIAPGAPADLVLLDGSPAEVLDALDAGLVAATLVAGRPVFVR